MVSAKCVQIWWQISSAEKVQRYFMGQIQELVIQFKKISKI